MPVLPIGKGFLGTFKKHDKEDSVKSLIKKGAERGFEEPAPALA